MPLRVYRKNDYKKFWRTHYFNTEQWQRQFKVRPARFGGTICTWNNRQQNWHTRHHKRRKIMNTIEKFNISWQEFFLKFLCRFSCTIKVVIRITPSSLVVALCRTRLFRWRCDLTRTMASLFLRFPDNTQRAPQSVGLLWMSDRLVAETSTLLHSTLNNRCPSPQRDSNPQSHQPSIRRRTT